MTQTANNYGTVLFELGVEKETVEEMKRIFSLTGELPRVLDCPVVSGREKHRLIEQLSHLPGIGAERGLEFLKRNVRPRKRIGDGGCL